MKDKNLIHDMRGSLALINSCFECIVVDLKDNVQPSKDDMADLEQGIDRFKCLLRQLEENCTKQVHNAP
jgi:hypothetical protein